MGKVTLVFEFEDGKEPAMHAGMLFEGGRIDSCLFADYRDRFLTDDEAEMIARHLDREPLDTQLAVMAKIERLTQ